MAKEVAVKIKITLDGQEKVITNIAETEAALRSLEQQLKKADFGSKQYKQIEKDLITLRSQLENVNKSSEGLGVEKRLRAINDTTNLLTGSFSVLTGALTIFASKEEDVVKLQQAEAKAMGALNIVLGIRSVREGILESRILRREAAEKISSATSKAYIATAKGISATLNSVGISAGVASTGVRALTAALAALGIPALIAGLTLLYDALTQTNDELESKAPQTAKEYYDELTKSIDKLNEQNELRLEFARTTGAGEIDLLQQELKQKQQIYDKLNEEVKELWITYGRLTGEALRNEDGFFFKSKTNYLNQAKVVKENIDKISQDLTKYSNQVRDTENKITDAEKKAAEKRQQEAKEAADKRKALELKTLQERLAQQKKYLEDLKVLIGEADVEEPEIITKLQNILDKQNDLIQQRTEFAKSESDKLKEALKLNILDVIPTAAEEADLNDAIASLFTRLFNNITFTGKINPLNEILKNSGKNLDIDQIIDVLATALGDASKSLEDNRVDFLTYLGLSEDDLNKVSSKSLEVLEDYFNLIGFFQKELGSKEFKNIFGKIFNEEETREILTNIQNQSYLLLQDTTLLAGQYEQEIGKVIQQQLGLQKKQVAGTDLQKEAAKGYNDELDILVKTLTEFGTKQSQVNIDISKFAIEATKLDGRIGKNKNLLENARLSEDEILNTIKVIQSSASQSSQAYFDFLDDIVSNTDGFRDRLLQKLSPQDLIRVIQEGGKGLKDLNFESEKQIEDIINNLIKLQVELGDAIKTGTTAEGEELGAGYALLEERIAELTKKLKELKKANDDVKQSWNDTFNESDFKKIAEQILSIFSDLSSRLSSIVGQQNSLLLEQLDYEQELALKNVGNTTKRENEIREQLEKDFAKRRFDIEKKARIQELQFALATAIGDGASAVINTLASVPFPANIPLSLVIGGLAGVQVALINDQIQFTQSKQFVGRRGGLIQGASHEGGGVPALLEGGEFVMSRAAVDTYGETLSTMNASVGSRPLAIDDSRIVQAIAKQNTATKMPIKTYVLYNDIQNTEKLNNKIEQLSRL